MLRINTKRNEKNKRWLRRNPTFEAHLHRLSSRVKKAAKIVMLRRVKVNGFAMTVLDCSECKWRIYLQSHHDYGTGNPHKLHEDDFKDKKTFEEHKKWRTKMLRSKTRCPQCNCDKFFYVKTEVMNHGKLYSELAD